jgi:hypothetical protein
MVKPSLMSSSAQVRELHGSSLLFLMNGLGFRDQRGLDGVDAFVDGGPATGKRAKEMSSSHLPIE